MIMKIAPTILERRRGSKGRKYKSGTKSKGWKLGTKNAHSRQYFGAACGHVQFRSALGRLHVKVGWSACVICRGSVIRGHGLLEKLKNIQKNKEMSICHKQPNLVGTSTGTRYW